ncbi:hypothetical protein E4414_11625 [Leptospira interrogans]|nr:hypothetical protein E4414_11625 [Leptospira interrogans]
MPILREAFALVFRIARSNYSVSLVRQIAFEIETKEGWCIMFPVCNLLTRTKEPGSVVRGKPDLPRFSYVELTLKLDRIELLKN